MRVPYGLTVTAVVGGLGVLEWYGFTRGFRLNDRLPAVKLGAGPFVGSWDFRLTALVIPAVAIAAVGVWILPLIVERWRAWRAIGVVAVAAAGFALALAASDGWAAVIAPVTDTTEYWSGIAKAKPAGSYLTTFLARQPGYSVHVRGHPPGFTLLLLLLRWADLGSAWAAAALSFIGVALAVAAVGFTVWRISGPDTLRRVLPFLAFAPYAVWQGTSADAFFSGVTATGIALLVVAMTTTQRNVEIASAIGGGLVLGAACFLTFGVPTLAPLVLGLAWRTRRIRWVVPAAIAASAIFVAFALHHYGWFTGLQHTRMFYAAGTAKFRPAFYFFFANLAVLAIAVGPAAIAGLTRLRQSPVGVIVVGALACVLLADASGLSKAETERIWLIYMPWIAVAAGALATTAWRQRMWLGAQAAGAVLVQVMLVSKW
ncbi:MAG: hypothetical protein JWN62_822 [Acidimicrobiales bacterium]|nr:hypothetical protein [Acidimicrobiales bacterium]